MSPVYIIIVLAKRARIKRKKNRGNSLSACYDVANKSFSCYPSSVRNRKYVATILTLLLSLAKFEIKQKIHIAQ